MADAEASGGLSGSSQLLSGSSQRPRQVNVSRKDSRVSLQRRESVRPPSNGSPRRESVRPPSNGSPRRESVRPSSNSSPRRESVRPITNGSRRDSRLLNTCSRRDSRMLGTALMSRRESNADVAGGLRGSPSAPNLGKRRLPSICGMHPEELLGAGANKRDAPSFRRTFQAPSAAPSEQPALARIRDRLRDAAAREAMETALRTKKVSKAAANKAWEEERYDECVYHLTEAIALVPSDVLHRYRSHANLRRGHYDDALEDAGKAVVLNALSPQNLLCQAHMLQRNEMLQEAGAAYLAAMNLGSYGQGQDEDYKGLLASVRRTRLYYNPVRQSLRKGHSFEAVKPSGPVNTSEAAKAQAEEKMAHRDLLPPSGRIVQVGESSCRIALSPPNSSISSEPQAYVVQIAEKTLQWVPESASFLELLSPFTAVHRGPASQLEVSLKGLKSDTTYVVRLGAENEHGVAWSKVFECYTHREVFHAELQALPVPRKWLQLDLHDIARLDTEARQCDMNEFYKDLYDAFKPQVRAIRRVFMGVSLLNTVGIKQVNGVTKQQFLRFLKDIGVVESSPKRAEGVKLLTVGECDLHFNTANINSFKSRPTPSPFKSLTSVMEFGDSVEADDDDDDDDDGGSSTMVLHEFAAALCALMLYVVDAYGSASMPCRVRLAWHAFPIPGFGTGERLSLLLSRVVVPRCGDMIQLTDSFDVIWNTKRVQAVTNYYREELSRIFHAFAAADHSMTSTGHQESMSLSELFFMMKAGGMFDERLTSAQLMAIFTRVNSVSAEQGVDDDVQELSESEFIEALGRICNLKIPASGRGGEKFETTWHSFLQLIFIPKYKKLIKQGLSKGLKPASRAFI